jgi:nucleotide-binding universal stress UspA family protein
VIPPDQPRATRTAARLRQILFPSDLTPSSDRAFDHARLLAESFGAQLTLYHVLETPPVGPRPSTPIEEEVFRRQEKAAREHLDLRAAAVAARAQVVVQRSPDARRALVTHLRLAKPDLTVMATHGREGLSHLFLGSVTERALERGDAPILCVREPEHGVAMPYRRILVPTDLTASSRRAFPLAALLARRFGAEVLIAHYSQVRAPASLSGVPELMESRVPGDGLVHEFLQEAFEGVRVTINVDLGSPWEKILETARTEKADVIVLSTHGPNSLSDRVLGSHAERVVRHSPCPVLVVPETGEPVAGRA